MAVGLGVVIDHCNVCPALEAEIARLEQEHAIQAQIAAAERELAVQTSIAQVERELAVQTSIAQVLWFCEDERGRVDHCVLQRYLHLCIRAYDYYRSNVNWHYRLTLPRWSGRSRSNGC